MLETQGRPWLDRAVKRWNDSWESRIDAAQFPQCAQAEVSAKKVIMWRGELESIFKDQVAVYLSRGLIDIAKEGRAEPKFYYYGDAVHAVAWTLNCDIETPMKRVCGQAIPNSRPNYTFPYVYWARNLWCADPESDLNK